MTAQEEVPPRIGLRLGVIADDVTGGADLAGMLTSQGVRTLLCLDVTAVPPEAVTDHSRWDAVTLALKIRSVPAAEAVSRALLALRSLQALEARQLFFKYCSTFDSTAAGNIGPVLDALMHATAVPSCCLVPALPVNGRTQYFGHLFVEGRLLSESPMRDHPLNPMRDPDLVRHLQAQTRRRVGLLCLQTVRAGTQALRAARARLEQEGVALALVDAIDDGDLRTIAEAFAEDRLVSGGSGLALALPGAWRERDGDSPGESRSDREHHAAGPTLILSGSCSVRTREQIACLEASAGAVERVRLHRVETGDLEDEESRLRGALAEQIRARGWAAVSSSTDAPIPVDSAGAGRGTPARLLERLNADLAAFAVAQLGVRSLVIAGGETSGAAVRALGLMALEVDGVLDPGVPICYALAPRGLTVVLKSGNFGQPDLFLKALRRFGHGASWTNASL